MSSPNSLRVVGVIKLTLKHEFLIAVLQRSGQLQLIMNMLPRNFSFFFFWGGGGSEGEARGEGTPGGALSACRICVDYSKKIGT